MRDEDGVVHAQTSLTKDQVKALPVSSIVKRNTAGG
jgi:hypothetical protein